MPKPTTFLSRWGLLTTTVLMGASLVAAGIAGYAAARTAASALVDSRSADVGFSVRRELHRSASADTASLQAILADLADLGVRSISVLDASGAIAASAGAPYQSDRDEPLRVRAPLESHWVGDRVRLIAALA
jgi:hypothetical protein